MNVRGDGHSTMATCLTLDEIHGLSLEPQWLYIRSPVCSWTAKDHVCSLLVMLCLPILGYSY